MATFKVNYAGLRKTQAKNESSKNFSEPPTTNAQSTASQPTLGQRTSSKANAAAQKDDAGFLSPYQGSFNSGNMEYINLLLKNKSSSTNKEKSPPKKKGRGRTKSNIADSAPKQSPIRLQSNSPESNRQLVAVPMNSVEENDKPSSMKPDDDDGVHIVRESIKKKTVKQRPEPHKDGFYEGDDTQRNINIAVSPPQYENKMIFERFVVGEGGNRRSMSVEDIRIEKQAMAMNHNHNKSTLHDPTEIGSYFERSPERTGHHDSKQSNPSSKGDFMASLDGYIDYFHKSDNMSYRNMKAGQYLRGNNGKSNRLIQKDLDAAMHELNIRNIHIQELKKTINDVLGENKVLKKELKAIHIREQEQHQLIQKMQTEIMHLHQKSHQYKSRCMQTEELLRQERSENENNLFSLKQVLANINVALEQRTSPFRNVTREKRQQTKGTLVDTLFMKKNRENLPKHYTTATKENTRGLERYASIYETVNHRGSTEHKGKRESSMLMSQKDSLLSSEEQSDSLTSNQFTDSNKYGITEETDDFQYQQHYQDSYRQSIAKNHQIRLLQEKLTELMRDDEDHYSSHTPHGKTGGIKTSRAKNPQHRRNMSDLGVVNFYMSRERQGSTGKHASLLSRHSPKEQRSRVMHNEYEGNTSMNGTERSFSVHESQEITE